MGRQGNIVMSVLRQWLSCVGVTKIKYYKISLNMLKEVLFFKTETKAIYYQDSKCITAEL
jgi:hypothetical protein